MRQMNSILQGALAAYQARQARKMATGLERPVMEVPQATQEAVGMSRSLAGTSRFAGQDEAENALNNQLASSTANVFDTATSSSEALDALVNLGGNRMSAQNKIAETAANDYLRRRQNLSGDLQVLGQVQQDMFEFNEVMPFEERQRAVEALRGATLENTFNAATGYVDSINQGMNDALSLAMMNGGTKSTGAAGGGIAGNATKSTVNTGSIVPTTLSPNNRSQFTPQQQAQLDMMFKAYNIPVPKFR